MNGVLQVIVYPLLNRIMGSDQLGELLYLMGLVAILCPSVGQALNTSRLVVRRDYQVTNGDYNILLLAFLRFLIRYSSVVFKISYKYTKYFRIIQ